MQASTSNHPHRSPDTVPHFGLIIIGDEILSGKRADRHLPKVIELLKARGLSLAYAEYVGDDPERITAALRRAFVSGDVVFSTGGIGATPDDHTRQCAARALGADLVLDREKPTTRVKPTSCIASTWVCFRKGPRSFPTPTTRFPGSVVAWSISFQAFPSWPGP